MNSKKYNFVLKLSAFLSTLIRLTSLQSQVVPPTSNNAALARYSKCLVQVTLRERLRDQESQVTTTCS